jgi:uncharacterized membrane protein
MYELLVLVHILAAIAWVGGGFTQQLAISQAAKVGSASADRQLVSMEWMEKYIYMPAPLLVLATGITMVIVSDAWGFSQSWVYSALILIVISGVLGGAVGGRLEKRLIALREEGSVETPGYAEVLARATRTGWLELVVLVAIVALMVYKPGV